LKLSNCSAGADFLRRLDQRHYEQMRNLVLVYADGIPKRLARIDEATTLAEIQKVFIELVDESAAT